MTSKQEFLARLHPAPLVPAGLSRPAAEVRYDGTADADFVRRWTAVGGSTHTCDEADVPELVGRIAAGRGPVLRADDPLTAGIPGDLQWPECGLEGAAAASVAVVGAIAAIAATGSVVLDSRRAHGRSAALLAPVAVFVVRRADLLSTPADLLHHTAARWPDGLPSQVVLVSGPSRSADIEMTLTRGVHGPGEVHVVLVGGNA